MSDFSDFEAMLDGQDSPLRVIERLSAAEIVKRYGAAHVRPFIERTFDSQDAVQITYNDTQRDLFLFKVRSPVDTWTIDTQNGGIVHIELDEIRSGITYNQRRKIDVQGEGALVIHCIAYDLEHARMIEKDEMVYIQPLYTNGFIVRGNVMLACKDEQGDIHHIPLEEYLGVKQDRLKKVSSAHITQQPVAQLKGAEKTARKQIEQGMRIGGPKEEAGEEADRTTRGGDKSDRGR